MGVTVGRILTAADLQLAARKTIDQTVNNSVTLVDDTELYVAVPASTVFQFELQAIYNTGTTPNIKFAWSYPSGLVIPRSATLANFASGWAGGVPADQTTVTVTQGFAGGDQYFRQTGLVIVGATPGTLRVRWAQATANASNTIMRTGSYLMLRSFT